MQGADIYITDILSAIIANGLTDEDELLSHMLTIMAAGWVRPRLSFIYQH